MVRLAHERMLLIGDSHRQLHSALTQALPAMELTSVPTVFDGIAEAAANSYSAILAAAEPIERRPEPAVRVLRQLAGKGRLVLFGHPTLEVLSRKMMQFGCDDYLITPPDPAELLEMFVAGATKASSAAASVADPAIEETVSPLRQFAELPFAEIILDALMQHPHDAPAAAVGVINGRLGSTMELRFARRGEKAPEAAEGKAVFSQIVRAGAEEVGAIHLIAPAGEDPVAVRHVLAQVAPLMAKAAGLQDRHNRLQKLAINDDLTGLYNARYFRHFLSRLLERAKAGRFPVTLLLFDIDDFKKYNDAYGHGAGDEILRQTAQLMRRCCREHDLVARIGGDEFAVVFWDKEGPRQPLDPKKPVGAFRPPQTPLQVFERFRQLAASSDFSGLGASGRGRLSVSGGLAVYPYDAQDVPGLIKAADDYLMFKAKKAGKNSLYLVEGQDPGGK